jgi:hypothetical protein
MFRRVRRTEQPDGRAGPDGDRWLDVEVARGELIACARHVLMGRPPDRLNKVALTGDRQLEPTPSNVASATPLRQRSSVEIDLSSGWFSAARWLSMDVDHGVVPVVSSHTKEAGLRRPK